jgi:calcineurin-like phosphoesterase family protein
MTIWYTADLHFGHENVIEFCDRPFKTVEEMDTTLLANMRKRVKKGDEIWILGDFAFGPRAKDRFYLSYLFGKIPCNKRHLVIGNHDAQPILDLPWTSVNNLVEVRDGSLKQNNTLCHYPMVTWNHSRRGALQLFGHVHGNWMGSRNSVNVGVDVWDYYPVTINEIEARGRDLPVSPHWIDAEAIS